MYKGWRLGSRDDNNSDTNEQPEICWKCQADALNTSDNQDYRNKVLLYHGRHTCGLKDEGNERGDDEKHTDSREHDQGTTVTASALKIRQLEKALQRNDSLMAMVPNASMTPEPSSVPSETGTLKELSDNAATVTATTTTKSKVFTKRPTSNPRRPTSFDKTNTVKFGKNRTESAREMSVVVTNGNGESTPTGVKTQRGVPKRTATLPVINAPNTPSLLDLSNPIRAASSMGNRKPSTAVDANTATPKPKENTDNNNEQEAGQEVPAEPESDPNDTSAGEALANQQTILVDTREQKDSKQQSDNQAEEVLDDAETPTENTNNDNDAAADSTEINRDMEELEEEMDITASNDMIKSEPSDQPQVVITATTPTTPPAHSFPPSEADECVREPITETQENSTENVENSQKQEKSQENEKEAAESILEPEKLPENKPAEPAKDQGSDNESDKVKTKGRKKLKKRSSKTAHENLQQKVTAMERSNSGNEKFEFFDANLGYIGHLGPRAASPDNDELASTERNVHTADEIENIHYKGEEEEVEHFKELIPS